MARERMVTRTITTNIFTVITVKMDTMSVVKTELSAPVDIDTVEKGDKYFRKNWNIPGFSYAAIESMTSTEKLYGMTEADFIAHAKELPARGGEQ